MSAKRPSLKGKGAEIFLGDENSEDRASEKSIQEVADRLQTRTAESQNAIKPERPTKQQPKTNTDDLKVEKEKATFYLPVDVLEDLESLWHDVRRITHKKIKKSEIVSIALQHASDEFRAWQNEERKRSKLMDRLSN